MFCEELGDGISFNTKLTQEGEEKRQTMDFAKGLIERTVRPFSMIVELHPHVEA